MTRTVGSTARAVSLICLAAALAIVSGPPTLAGATSQSAPLSARTSAGAGSTSTARTARTERAARRAAVDTAADFSSIFGGQSPALVNAGWSSCAAPVTWSLDPGSLPHAEVEAQVASLQWAFDEWSAASGLTFQYSGVVDVDYRDASFTMAPADGSASARRHVYLAFVDDGDSDRMGGGIVGLGAPIQVFTDSREIVTGAAVFRTDHVRTAATPAVRSLYLHELGHVLGLAHASMTANIMYSMVTDHLELGSGDVNGVRTISKPCLQPA